MSISKKTVLAAAVTVTLIAYILLVTLTANARIARLNTEYDDAEQQLMLAQALERGIATANARLSELEREHGGIMARLSASAGAPEVVAALSALLDKHGVEYGSMALSGDLSEISGGNEAQGVRELVILLDVSSPSLNMTAFCAALENDAALLFRIRAASLSGQDGVMSGSLTVCCYTLG